MNLNKFKYFKISTQNFNVIFEVTIKENKNKIKSINAI